MCVYEGVCAAAGVRPWVRAPLCLSQSCVSAQVFNSLENFRPDLPTSRIQVWEPVIRETIGQGLDIRKRDQESKSQTQEWPQVCTGSKRDQRVYACVVYMCSRGPDCQQLDWSCRHIFAGTCTSWSPSQQQRRNPWQRSWAERRTMQCVTWKALTSTCSHPSG